MSLGNVRSKAMYLPEERLEAGKAPARRLVPGKPSAVLLNRMFGIPVARLCTKAALKRGILGAPHVSSAAGHEAIKGMQFAGKKVRLVFE